jgi:hypothetical protein
VFRRLEKEAKGKFFGPDTSLVGCGTVPTGKFSLHKRILLTSLGSCSGRVMEFYFEKWVNVACFLKS